MTTALDTNVLVRILVDSDDPAQRERARALLDGRRLLVSPSVIVETDWVLRTEGNFRREERVDAIRAFLGLAFVDCVQAEEVRQALDWSSRGLDLADAMHLAVSSDATAMVTFDERFVTRAARAGAHPPVLSP
jgi:predicted nucleic acid-binding protein